MKTRKDLPYDDADNDADDDFYRQTIDLIWSSLVRLPLTLIGVALLTVALMSVSLRVQTDSNHGDNLIEFIRTTRSLEYEVHANFTTKGDKLYEATQFDTMQVSYSLEAAWMTKILGLGKTISVHNHPNGVPFTNTDLLNEAQVKPTALMVVTDANVYTLTPQYGWPSSEDLQAFLNETEQKYAPEDLESQPNYNLESGWLEIFFDNELRENFLSWSGFDYVVTPTDEWRLSMLAGAMAS